MNLKTRCSFQCVETSIGLQQKHVLAFASHMGQTMICYHSKCDRQRQLQSMCSFVPDCDGQHKLHTLPTGISVHEPRRRSRLRCREVRIQPGVYPVRRWAFCSGSGVCGMPAVLQRNLPKRNRKRLVQKLRLLILQRPGRLQMLPRGTNTGSRSVRGVSCWYGMGERRVQTLL